MRVVRYLWILGAAVVASYTAMYGVETWKQGNHSGAVGVIIVAVLAVVVPAAVLLLR